VEPPLVVQPLVALLVVPLQAGLLLEPGLQLPEGLALVAL